MASSLFKKPQVKHAIAPRFVWAIIKEVRPRQWVKNFALFAGLLLSGQLNSQEAFLVTVQAFTVFCIASSATYTLNDIFDIERDKLHPFKSKRPLPNGLISVTHAIILAIILTASSLYLAYQITPSFFFATLTYLVLQLLYSSYIKSIILLDVMAIAAGFVLRVYAGVWAIDAHLNVWFLLTVVSFALFLAIGKRRSELTLLQAQASKHRETLLHYPENLLDILTSMFANSTWLAYAIFTFLQPPISARPTVIKIFSNISLPISEAKYLMATIPIVIYGVMRYLYIIYEKREGESPERVLLTDKPLLTAVILWLIATIGIIYYWGG